MNLDQCLNPTCVFYLSYLHCFHMEVGLGMRLGVLGSDLPILGGNVPKNDPVHSFFILLIMAPFQEIDDLQF